MSDERRVIGNGVHRTREEVTMLWAIVVFAAIGVLAGASAWVFYPDRLPGHILATLLLGAVGALAAGMLSWLSWPAEEEHIPFASLLVSLVATPRSP
jgi:uncharacterized membrane protein YeaQ/YmgE (transglycosylase-associated protein family)